MNATNLMSDTSNDYCPFLFFDKFKPHKYKVYNDGSHYVGTLCVRNQIPRKSALKVRGKMDDIFDELFLQAVQA